MCCAQVTHSCTGKGDSLSFFLWLHLCSTSGWWRENVYIILHLTDYFIFGCTSQPAFFLWKNSFSRLWSARKIKYFPSRQWWSGEDVLFTAQQLNFLLSANLVFSALVSDLKMKPSVHSPVAFMLCTKMSQDVALMIFKTFQTESSCHDLMAF